MVSSAGGCPTTSTLPGIPSPISSSAGSRGSPGEAPGAALEKLEALLAQAHLALAEAVPLVAELLALPLPAERYPPRPLPPEQQRQRTFDSAPGPGGGTGRTAARTPDCRRPALGGPVDPGTARAPARPGTDACASIRCSRAAPRFSPPGASART